MWGERFFLPVFVLGRSHVPLACFYFHLSQETCGQSRAWKQKQTNRRPLYCYVCVCVWYFFFFTIDLFPRFSGPDAPLVVAENIFFFAHISLRATVSNRSEDTNVNALHPAEPLSRQEAWTAEETISSYSHDLIVYTKRDVPVDCWIWFPARDNMGSIHPGGNYGWDIKHTLGVLDTRMIN